MTPTTTNDDADANTYANTNDDMIAYELQELFNENLQNSYSLRMKYRVTVEQSSLWVRVEERLYINRLGYLSRIRHQVTVNPLQPADFARSKSFIPPAFSSTKPTLDKNRVAVLPLQNMSPDLADEYFADGMTEELIDRLSQVKSLQVIARTSVMNYKKKEKNVSEIAKELSVGSVVEGSVRKAGNRVRVTVQLISAETEAHLWSSHYDKNLDDIFAVQSEIAEKVAGELQTRLLDSEKKTLEKKATENTEAFTCFLRGRELYNEETETSFRQALSLFEKAIELDPKFRRPTWE